MRHVKTFALFESEKTLTQEQKEFLNKHTEGSWRVNPKTGLVDVDGDFNCSGRELKDLVGIEFGVVSGDFFCHINKLTSLEGAPREVGVSFSCSRNQLTSLEGGPREVGGSFSCYRNKLTSLEGAPQEVGGNFSCYKNLLTSLEGGPQRVGGSFSCSNNQLTSLKGGPREVGGDFFCDGNNFTSLRGEPERVGGHFYPSFDGGFKWNIKGKFEYLTNNPELASLILPTIAYESLIKEVPESPTLLKSIEDFDKNMYDRILKDLCWDKMGPDLLRQLKNGIV